MKINTDLQIYEVKYSSAGAGKTRKLALQMTLCAYRFEEQYRARGYAACWRWHCRTIQGQATPL